MIFRYAVISFVIIGLSGCAIAPKPVPTFPIVKDKTQAWQHYQHQAIRVHQWHITGVVGVKKGKKAYSANLDWRQNFQQYNMDFYGPLGIGDTRIQGDQQQAMLTTHQGKIYRAHSAEGLMEETLGWSVPIYGLLYWVRGLPVTGFPAGYKINRYGFLSHLSQQGWSIDYQQYQRVGSHILPQKILLKRGDLSVTLVIDDWGLH